MPTLAYGLNVSKNTKATPATHPPLKRKRIFDEEDGDGEEEEARSENAAEEIETFVSAIPNLPSTKSSNKRSSESIPRRPHVTQYGDLSAAHTAAKHARTAQAVDSSVYDYDGVYDSFHAKSSASTTSSMAKGPKYMGNLLAAAEIRKRDQLRAKEKMLLKEREAEGDEFVDKEKFVTGAYKAQQEKVKRMEEEESRREVAEEEKRRKGGGMIGLYKGLLDRTEERHAEIIKAVKENHGKGAQPDEAHAEPDPDNYESELAKAKGAVVNEDGQIVDKRQLLRAGLNVALKPKGGLSSTFSSTSGALRRATTDLPAGSSSRAGAKQAQRERQTKMLEQQLEAQARKGREEEDAKKKLLEESRESQKTEKDIGSARERYLARKREAEEASKRGESVAL